MRLRFPMLLLAALGAVPSPALAAGPKAEIGFDFHFDSTSTNTDGNSVSGSELGLAGYYLFIMKQIHVGPELSYSSSAQGDLKSSSLDLGGLGRYCFGKMKLHGILPYALAGLALGQRTVAGADGASISESENRLKLGGGALYFLSPNSAVQADLTYRITNDAGNGSKSTTSGFYLEAGLGVFI